MKYQITSEQKQEIERARKTNKNKQTENRLKVGSSLEPVGKNLQ